jgi:hypothetical protein
MDGNIKSSVELSKPNSGDTSDDNADNSLSAAVSAAGGEAAFEDMIAADVDSDYNYSGTYESIGYSSWVFSEKGILYAIQNHYKSYDDSDGNYVSSTEYSLCSWNLNGELLDCISMDDILASDGWINKMLGFPDGRLFIMYYDDNGDLLTIIYSPDDGFSEPVSMTADEETADVWNWINNFVIKDDTSAYIIWSNMDDNWNYYITTYDFDTNKMGESTKLPETFGYSFYSVAAGVDTDLVFSMQDGLFGYNIGDENATQIMSCINSDLSAYSLYNYEIIDSDHFIAFYNEYNTYETKGGYFTRVAPEDVPDKSVLVLGGFYVGSDVKSKVVDFNKSSSEYRIVVTDYSTYSTNDDYEAGLTKLNNDIISGNMPDILEYSSDLPLDNYISKGLVADIDKLIDADDELKDKEFLQNIFDAYRVDGKLYYVIPYFYVSTYAAKTSLVGDRTSWTMDEMEQVLSTLPEGSTAFGNWNRTEFMWEMMSFCGSDFIDVSSGKCDFDSESFIKMLEYANTLPEEIADDVYDDYWNNYDTQYRENRTLLMNVYISSSSNISSYINGYFGEDISFVGFPNESGQGGIINISDGFAISSKSANIDGAWQFVRQYLLDDFQNNVGDAYYGIPVSKSAFDEWAKKGMEKPYYMSGDEKVEYDDTFYLSGEEITIPVLTQEQTDMIKDYITSLNKPFFYNNDVQNIISEEAEAYFSGQKSVEDVAAIIQSRVQIYVNENR